MRVYISGKITGEFNYKEKFDTAEKMLKKKGHIALNPTIIPLGLEYDQYIKIDLAMVDAADAIYMLDNWTDSRGANIEYDHANLQGKKILYQELEG